MTGSIDLGRPQRKRADRLDRAFDVKLKSELNGIDIGEQYEGLDFGVIAGAGVEITRFLIEARYNWGLRNILNGNLTTTTEIKTRTFAILFGVRFS